MGTLQLSELREEVHDAHGNRNDLTDARLDRIINMSQERIARRYRFEELVDLATIDLDSEEITLPDNVQKLYHISIRDKTDTSGYTSDLVRVTRKKLFQLRQLKDSPNTRRPVYYNRYGQKVRVQAPPDKTYLAEYVFSAYPTKLVGDADKSDFDSLDDAIIALSVSWLFAIKGNTDEANRWFRIFNNSMGDARLEDFDTPDAELSTETTESGDRLAPRYYEDPFQMSMPRV